MTCCDGLTRKKESSGCGNRTHTHKELDFESSASTNSAKPPLLAKDGLSWRDGQVLNFKKFRIRKDFQRKAAKNAKETQSKSE
jgi:hypothetical protein